MANHNALKSILLFGLLIGQTFAAPQGGVPGAAPAGGAPPGAGGILPVALPIHALPHSGIVGAFDNIGAALANFGNAQGSGWDAILSGFFNSIGTFFSGLFGSGAVNTAFLNYNNRPPIDPADFGGGGGGADPGGAAGPPGPPQPPPPPADPPPS